MVRLGDGTDIADIRLGDGTDIGEVRKGDGTVLWTPAITDSEQLYHEGEGEDDWEPLVRAGDPTHEKRDDHLYIFAEGKTEGASWEFYEKFDVSSLTEIEIEWEQEVESDGSTNAGSLALIEESGENPRGAEHEITYDVTFSRRTDTLDVSDVDGDYIVAIGAEDFSSDHLRFIEQRVYRVEYFD